MTSYWQYSAMHVVERFIVTAIKRLRVMVYW